MELTNIELKRLLSYDEKTGVFTWLPCAKYRRKASNAGYVQADGYVRIMVNRKRWYAHRLAWLYVTGKVPVDCIDHIDGMKSNNAFANLRAATQDQNKQNIKAPHKKTKSGLLGVSKNGNRWIAKICTEGVQKNVGSFASKEDAHAAYLNAKRAIHPFCTI